MSTEPVLVDAGHFHCQIRGALVNGDIVLCSGVKFVQVDEHRCELVLLTEADVESLTAPGGSS